MGTITLKKKREMHYRRGPASGGCLYCNSYVPHFGVSKGLEYVYEPRCLLMGLEQGRAYRIHPDNICDRHDNSRYLARLKGADQ